VTTTIELWTIFTKDLAQPASEEQKTKKQNQRQKILVHL